MTRVVTAVALLVACGCASRATTVSDPATVVIAAPVPPSSAPAPEERSQLANPFAPGQAWRGHYFCAQGKTELLVRIDEVDNEVVRGVFDFTHEPTEVHGAYLIMGRWDAIRRSLTFHPGGWISRPPNYYAVGLDGRVTLDGRRFSGRITDPSCEDFTLRRED